MQILVINSGSSSLKFQLFNKKDLSVIATGMIEQIGEETGRAQLKWKDREGTDRQRTQAESLPTHREAIELMAGLLRETGYRLRDMNGIGHRVVHGGESFREPTLIDSATIDAIEKLEPLAPLHNPANLTGIRMAMERAPHIPQVAVFDTAFHQSIPEHAYIYALPYRLYREYSVRRYGFHGTSHGYVSREAAKFLGTPYEKARIITLHLGNGASAAAIRHGRCIDTSMGLTPLEGLVMGTRCGDIDPAIPFYLAREAGMNIQELDSLLNKSSGLKGICGENDLRTILDMAGQGDQQAELALEIFCYRIRKYTGAYLAALGGADCIVFTGGIGENSPDVRRKSLEGLEGLGIAIDPNLNSRPAEGIFRISPDTGQVAVLVVPTDEELEIARQTRKVIEDRKST